MSAGLAWAHKETEVNVDKQDGVWYGIIGFNVHSTHYRSCWCVDRILYVVKTVTATYAYFFCAAAKASAACSLDRR